MIFITVKNDVVTSQHFMPFDEKYGLGKSKEELLKEGFFVDTIPLPQEIQGKVAILKYDGTSLYYEYQDARDETTVLKKQVAEQEQAIMELTALLSGGGVNV